MAALADNLVVPADARRSSDGMEHSRYGDNKREGLVIRWMAWAIAALLKPKALLVAETLCLMFIFSERHLRHVLAEYVGYFNRWRPHRSIGQRAPCAPPLAVQRNIGGKIIAKPVLGGLHQIYDLAA